MRAVLAQAHLVADHAGVGDRIVFAGRTPYSAGFYFDRTVSHHPGESAAATIRRTLTAREPCLLIVRDTDLDAVPRERRGQFRPLIPDGSWRCLVVGATGGMTPNGLATRSSLVDLPSTAPTKPPGV